MSNQDLLFAAFGLVVLLAFILQSFWLYKSVPPSAVAKLFVEAKALADKTPSKLDDMVVDGAKMAYDFALSQEKGESGVTTTSTSITSTTSTPVSESKG